MVMVIYCLLSIVIGFILGYAYKQNEVIEKGGQKYI
jgi:hypothetical protein